MMNTLYRTIILTKSEIKTKSPESALSLTLQHGHHMHLLVPVPVLDGAVPLTSDKRRA